LIKLSELRDKNIITEENFNQKKAEILSDCRFLLAQLMNRDIAFGVRFLN